MTSRDFAYWLQGFFEMSDSIQLSEKQVQQIKNHLAMVFKHEIDPSFGDAEKQAELAKEHNRQSQALTDALRKIDWPSAKINC